MRKDLYTNGSVDLPAITKKRSFFDLTHSSHIDMNVGSLYPLDQVIPIMPGDTFDYSHRLNIRMTNPPKNPTMDQLVFDIYWFYVPNRIVWDNFDNFITNKASNYYSDFSFTYPVCDIQNPNLSGSAYPKLEGSVLDYLGFGCLAFKGSSVGGAFNPSALPVRGYYRIWNEYFRYEPLQSEILVGTTDTAIPYTAYMNINNLGSSSAQDFYQASADQANVYNDLMNLQCYGYCLAPVNRLPGYFSRSLPQPLAGSDVKILEDVQIGNTSNFIKATWYSAPGSSAYIETASNNTTDYLESASNGSKLVAFSGKLSSTDNSIRALANAFALNKFLYIDNIYGKRITEWTYGHFGVNVPDSRVQRPEFLAKRRIYININQIMQSSETTTSSPQGNAGAWSQTFDSAKDFVKSFVEFGYLHTMACIRVLNHSYSQGIDKHWTYRTRFDYPLPEFQNAGDQEVKGYEIYADTSTPGFTWGYQERYAECKMIPSRVAGHMRPQSSNTLAVWTYTDYYSSKPTLSATWIIEPTANFERTQYFAQSVAPSFIVDSVIDLKAYRSLQYHSIPGGLTGSI